MLGLNVTVGFCGVVDRVCSSRAAVSDCPSQPSTTWKLKALSATALSQSASCATKNTILMLLLCSLEQVFDLTFGYMVQIWTFTYCLLLWQIFPGIFFHTEIWKHDTDFSINCHCFSISYFVNIIYHFRY